MLKQAKVLWFTGLSGSGKTTIAKELKKRLEIQGKRVHIVDADEVRASYPEPLGFSREDIRENNRRHALIAREKLADNDVVIVAIISPFAEDRIMAREMLGGALALVYVKTALETVIKRDTMGLYGKALRGEKDDVIGMTASKIPYEPPPDADIEVRTDNASIGGCVEEILSRLMSNPVSDFSKEARTAIAAARKAGEAILAVYKSDFSSSLKNDREPVTEADIRSNKILLRELSRLGYPILSEESEDNSGRLTANALWIIDPLDGTSDFIRRTGEFSVMIALVRESIPVIGVIYRPTADVLFVAEKERGARLMTPDTTKRLHVSNHHESVSVITSRSHLSEQEGAFIRELTLKEHIKMGSAGLKVAEVASGNADIYFTTTNKMKQWDTAAAHCLIEEAGGRMSDMFGSPLRYNTADIFHRRGILVTNGLLHDDIIEYYRAFSG